ncbi:MAG: ABC transporter permease, partial [Cyclobacteriaceae bacterium]
MILNYLIIAFRNLRDKKVYSIINIVGLAIGLAACIIMLYYVKHESSYDTFHTRHQRIGRITYETTKETEARGIAKTPFPMKPVLLGEYPEV